MLEDVARWKRDLVLYIIANQMSIDKLRKKSLFEGFDEYTAQVSNKLKQKFTSPRPAFPPALSNSKNQSARDGTST